MAATRQAPGLARTRRIVLTPGIYINALAKRASVSARCFLRDAICADAGYI
jgi:hypothetical protein